MFRIAATAFPVSYLPQHSVSKHTGACQIMLLNSKLKQDSTYFLLECDANQEHKFTSAEEKTLCLHSQNLSK
jgi:hypothetical protein